ncbi:cysteine desulfurase DndA [Amycolatopsis vastitatis]|uniref:cysteine desulfurase n=1 Tax=Amycolatopsis vastitatis TaxID=1905142 RepID=A0A229T2S4_9PSEU|nr:cysteine desulfurase DndA [Amycolatopsis vastitatis]OXM65310.1 cysteine desulfurase DndA [Amycolatopsis vastitatis]
MAASARTTRTITTTSEDTTTRAVYLDCNATAPMDARVQDEVHYYLDQEFGNAGSRTHEYGQRAKERVIRAREQVASLVASAPDEVVFTSGATEADNLALLGLAPHGEQHDRRHIISSQIEHKAVLEPLDALRERGFEVTLLPPQRGGWINPDQVRDALRPDTLAVSIMHVNNETGVIQPIEEIGAVLDGHDAYFHVDAAQGFGKVPETLQNTRIDLISVSGHKVYGPKGVGALITRRRGFRKPPLTPLMYGGGQERGLRPGTLPVALIAGLGTAAELAGKEHQARSEANLRYRQTIVDTFLELGGQINGDPDRAVPHTLNVAIPGLDSEAVMLALKGFAAISNGSACTSQRYEPSHVLAAMGLPEPQVAGALRISWDHKTPMIDVEEVRQRIKAIM